MRFSGDPVILSSWYREKDIHWNSLYKCKCPSQKNKFSHTQKSKFYSMSGIKKKKKKPSSKVAYEGWESYSATIHKTKSPSREWESTVFAKKKKIISPY